MNTKEAAQMLTGREYGGEITRQEENERSMNMKQQKQPVRSTRHGAEKVAQLIADGVITDRDVADYLTRMAIAQRKAVVDPEWPRAMQMPS